MNPPVIPVLSKTQRIDGFHEKTSKELWFSG
jgi:hypothetical protein